ncbi:MAG TPA: cysteine--tRNA ligase [Roseiflexaceae bacterium]|nr:cysteine--tRNA ligase [Roseiflexaceae bacterium]HMP39620.1 cysteine--tRNA ligase [Roseiflexaceae bacterium]
MPIQLYNTLSRRKELFETIKPGEVGMYVCGVTVYDRAHIGHAMSAIVFDIIRRYLEYRHYTVRHIVNFTDVDDKIINRALSLGRDPIELASAYVAEFHEDLAALHVKPATAYPRVTETIPEIIDFIEGLIAGEHAYAAAGDVYFRVAADDDYGKLSGRSVEDMLAGTRFEVDERKESPADFALWKAAKPGEPAWESPWGPGRPGWHIECSAMSLATLGDQIDIHGGGADLIFPHHENEIAQSESLTGKPFARYWVHNGMLQIRTRMPDGSYHIEKMSKSLGNVVTIREFLAEHPADVLRLIVLASSYRSPLAYGPDILADQERRFERLRSALLPATGDATSGAAVDRLAVAVQAAHDGFVAAMDDDFNTAGGMAAIFELVRAINTARDAGVGGEPFATAQATVRELSGVLGLTLTTGETTAQHTAPLIELLIELRAELRKARQFALADMVRDRLAGLDIILEDTAQGTRWKAK